MAFCNMWTGLISLSLILVAGLFLCLRQDPQDATSHEKRWTPDGSHLRPLKRGGGHLFLQNYWYRYVYETAKAQNKTDCYVCSIMPVHSQGPTVYVRKIYFTEAACAFSVGLWGYAKHIHFTVPGQNLTEGEGIQVVGKDNKTYTYYNNSLAYAALIQVDATLDPKTDDYDDTEKNYFTELQNKDHYSYDDML
ncbi:hypothetical protein ATANTOWER_025269 [Ataeniobius toweri]|uniref:Uncharacterized protein n=1 Tax=Ataeniobius toweri TaxID=208326 RepID=A0ABU7BKP9_9TELE|nr:hypothetical protein [Ataeniobius toweri]